jgi:GntR family transcriptional regulator/MocR family aminotransferase
MTMSGRCGIAIARSALAEFLAAGHFARHLRRMRAIYQQRRDALVAALQRIPAAPLTIVNADAGMHLTAWLPAGVDDREIVRRAQARGISAIALSTCYAGRASRPGLVLGFGGVDASRIGPAVEVLAEVIRESVRTPRRPRRGSAAGAAR